MFKKKELLLFLGLFSLYAFNVAEAKFYFSDDKIYIRGNAYVGYSYSMSDSIRNNSDLVGVNNQHKYETKNFLRHSPIVGVGANLYFKINKRLDLLAGVDITGRMPVNTKTEESLYVENESYAYDDRYVFREYAKLNAKLGVKANFDKNFAIESYCLAGINVAKFDKSFDYINNKDLLIEYNKTGTNIGAVLGAGANLVIKDRYTIGIEYYNSCNTRNVVSSNGIGKKIDFKSHLNIHNVLVKFGVQF